MGPTTRSKSGSPAVSKKKVGERNITLPANEFDPNCVTQGQPGFFVKTGRRGKRKQLRPTIKQPVPPMVLQGLPHLSKSFVGAVSNESENCELVSENVATDGNVTELQPSVVNYEIQNDKQSLNSETIVDENKQVSETLMAIAAMCDLSKPLVEEEDVSASSVKHELNASVEFESPAQDSCTQEELSKEKEASSMNIENDNLEEGSKNENENIIPIIIGPPEPPKEFFDKIRTEAEISDCITDSTKSKHDEIEDSSLNKLADEELTLSNQISVNVVKVSEGDEEEKSDEVNQVSVPNISPSKTEVSENLIKLVDGAGKSGESQVEYISVYSSDDRKKKVAVKKSDDQKISSDLQESKIVPMPLPMPMLVDPKQLEKETEEYYKEVGKMGSSSANSTAVIKKKPKSMTPFVVAKIAKEAMENEEASRELQVAWSTLHQYWSHVQENPYDFDGWTYLLNHVETMENIEAARSAFEGFLPLYPYCFAYWKKLSDLELKFTDLEQSLGVLFSGCKSVPFCCELWTPLLEKFAEYAAKENISDETVRGLYEYALDNIGMSWHSSPIWELYIEYEMNKEELVRVVHLYKRLISVPTKLYMKHWDSLITIIRDYHPRNFLSVGEYYKLKKVASDKLKVKFNPPPMIPPKHLLKITQPEEKVQATMKEIIVASLIPIHEANEKEVDKRWKFEDKIKRPYFHVKPLEKKQLKLWKEYLNFEINERDPVRIVSLFERCMVPCALYEEFWCKYASYMEEHILNVSNSKYAGVEYKPRYFHLTEESGDEIVGKNKTSQLGQIGEHFSMVLPLTAEAKTEAKKEQVAASMNVEFWEAEDKKSVGVMREIKFEVMFLMNRLSESINVGGKVLTPPSLTPSSILQGLTWDDVRQIYRRGAWIHCPSKPLLLMQWAQFEESQGNVQTARELLNTVVSKNPSLLKARILLIELERRARQNDRVEELFGQAYAYFKEARLKSYIAIRYARFLFKIKEEDEKALMILRKAMKKDKMNIHLYHHVFDICYQRRPVDLDGVLAATMLAVASKEVSLEEKRWFCMKRSNFLREHGTLAQLKIAKIEAKEIERKYEAEVAEKVKKEKEEALLKAAEEKEKKEALAKEEIKKPVKAESKNIPVIPQVPIKTPVIADKAVVKATPKITPVIKALPKKDGPEIRERRSRNRPKSPSHSRRRSRREGRDSKRPMDEGRDKERREGEEGKEHRRSSKRAKRSRERHHSSGSRKKPKDTIEEVLYAPDGTILYDPRENEPDNFNNCPSMDNMNPNQMPLGGFPMPRFPNQQMQSYPGQNIQGYPQMNTYQNSNQQLPGVQINNDQGYNAMPPTWDVNTPSLANYGYGTTPLVKETQNALYNRYYDLVDQGYKGKDVDQQQLPDMQNTYNGSQAPPTIGRPANSYLPPPPVPQGILGDSLFNQGSISNFNNQSFGKGELNKQNFEPNRQQYPMEGISSTGPPPGTNFQGQGPNFLLQSHQMPSHIGSGQGQDALQNQGQNFPLQNQQMPSHVGSSQGQDMLPNQGHNFPSQSKPIPTHVGSGQGPEEHKHQGLNYTMQSHQIPSHLGIGSGPGQETLPNLNERGGDVSAGQPIKSIASGANPPGMNFSTVVAPNPGIAENIHDVDDNLSRSAKNVLDMIKEQRNKSNENAEFSRQDEMKVLPSGRNAINVAALLKNRNASGADNKSDDLTNVPQKINQRSDRKSFEQKRSVNMAPGLLGERPGQLPGSALFNANADGKQNFSQGSIPHDIPNKVMLGFNVPDWLVNEGGELRLSSTPNGVSLLRYWPRYMNEHGHKTLFQSLRKSVKWFQRRCKMSKDDNWVALPKLISWLGPCDYEKDGMILLSNTNWPPEVVDLLHRLNHFSNCSFNSCFLSLYTNGFSHHPWHNEEHTAIEKNPTIATISLGATRTMEMRRIDGPEYIRLPMLPGSLFVLEGASQADWLCQIPREPEVVSERISVSFRMMLMIKGVTV